MEDFFVHYTLSADGKVNLQILSMRIISGKYKGKRFDVPHTFKARPTTDFAKESLFNILSNNYVDFDEQPTALDLFSGTGSISLELISRGCGSVVSVEKDFKHWQFLSRICHELGDKAWKSLHADVFKFISKSSSLQGFDIIFADPPYALENLGDLPELVLNSELIKYDDNGKSESVFILEHGRNYDFSQHSRFIEHRSYGSVNFSFFR